MTKEELLKQLKKENESTVAKLNPTTMGTYARGMGYSDGLDYAVGLVEKLDEPKKVVIPQLIAKLIEGASVIYGNEPLRIAHGIVAKGTSNDNGGSWLSDVNNQKLLLNAIVNGYEVEKEPELHVKLKGLVIGSAYLNYNIPFKTFSTNSLSSPKHMNTEFTKSWLAKNWPEYEAYNNAGLLEFEEVEDE